MKVKQLVKEDDAVSPVIGVILMVAITVILAAVIASFVLGLGGNQQKTPTASFSWDYEDKTGSAGIATVSHDGGDTIKANELIFRGNGYDDTVSSYDIGTPGTNWTHANATGSMGGEPAVVGGNTVDIGAESDYDMTLVWEPAEGDTSATLSEDTGPGA